MKPHKKNRLSLLNGLCALVWAIACWSAAPAYAQAGRETLRPRIVVTADPELDDLNSLIRFLLYSTDLRVEGLVYASSQFHWKGDGKGTLKSVPGREYNRFGLNLCPCASWRWADNERFIHDAVDAYEKVYPNLKVHHPDYPEPEMLRSKIRYGNIEFDGDISKDSPGSDLIKALMLDNEPGPLFITAWGGQSTIARALKSIQEQYENTPSWAAVREKVSRKVVLLPSGDQDDTYARYIKPNWPDIDYRQFSGGPNYAYGAQLGASPQDSLYLTAAWMKAQVSGRGPLGALYRVWGDGKQMVKGDIFDYFGMSGYTGEQLKQLGYVVWMPVQEPGAWLGEGDTGTFMNMLNNGLRAWEAGAYGGWGGRQAGSTLVFQFNNDSTRTDTTLAGMVNAISTLGAQRSGEAGAGQFPDFFPAAQRDFAARLQWSVTPRFDDANHEPRVGIAGPANIRVAPGEQLMLTGTASDPDGDALTLRWLPFPTGTYPGAVTLANPDSLTTTLTVPADALPGQTIHLVLEVSDGGSPVLTRYQRVVLTVGKR